MTIQGIKLIKHNANGINLPDDTSYPFKLEASFRAPEFMSFTFVALFGGTEEVIVRGMTEEALEEFVKENELRNHPRLIKLTITKGD